MNWQPISTAPKTGRSVLLYARDGNCGEKGHFIAYWEKRNKRWMSGLGAEFFEPTHWRELTKPTRKPRPLTPPEEP